MELKFGNKLTEKQILSNANKVKTNFEISDDISILFKGDNFEALSILLRKFKNKINLVYIDPPFNTEQEFLFLKMEEQTLLVILKTILLLIQIK